MNIKDIEPTKGRVLVELPEKSLQVGDIVLADSDQANTAPVRGTVIRVPASGSICKVGETIFFRKYAIDELKFNEDDLNEVKVYIVEEDEILGVVRRIERQERIEDNAVEVRSQSKEADKELKEKIK